MRHRITEIAGRYKGAAGEWVLPAILVLLGLTAFGLGRLSVMGEEGPRLIIKLPDGTTQTAAAYAAAPAAQSAPAPATAGEYVASKSGERYYPTGCAAAGRIKEENRVYFATMAAAEAAGYTKAANC